MRRYSLQKKIVSESTCDLSISRFPYNFPTTVHVMPGFQENLAGASNMCDADYTVTFNKNAVAIYISIGTNIITGWREAYVPHLWSMSLIPIIEEIPQL